MEYQKHEIGNAHFFTYVLSNYEEINPNRKRPFIVICPGGGYHFCSDREAEAVAVKFLSYGFNCGVLYYTCHPVGHFPCALGELAKTVAFVRQHAEQMNTDPQKIAIMGFSAGGHLAGCLGTFWHEKWLSQEVGLDGECFRPNAQVLCYPVITSGEKAHLGSFQNLLGQRFDELKDSLSLEKRVTKDTVPTFIWTTLEDKSVPIENTLLYASALKSAEVSFAMHVFSRGLHGLSLATLEVASKKHPEANEEVSQWPDMVSKWLYSRFGTSFFLDAMKE